MNRIIFLILLTGVTLSSEAQRVLSLDSCRALAIAGNKQMTASRVKQEVAANLRKSARTKYLPHVSAIGGYEYTSREISILNDDQKSALNNLGTYAGALLATQAPALAGAIPTGAVPMLNMLGSGIADAFRTDSRNIVAGAVTLVQPVFMGGSIVAANRIADLGVKMAANNAETVQQQTLYTVDQAYWQVVSLCHKQKLAKSYLELVRKLDADVQKMIAEGVATRSEGLSVSVKVNEAEMTLAKVDDGLTLSRMNLLQLCGIPMNENVVLADENIVSIDSKVSAENVDVESAVSRRPELRMLQNTVDISRQATNILRAGNLPQVALMGGYMISNPNLYNGFERKFAGAWNVGVLVRVPIWNWGDVAYKVRAAKGATTMAELELDEAREKIELQVNQSSFRVGEAERRLALAETSISKAEENLRTANIGFREGVISSTTVMEAQTAWLQAQSQKIDAEIEVKLSQTNLQKALGTLAP